MIDTILRKFHCSLARRVAAVLGAATLSVFLAGCETQTSSGLPAIGPAGPAAPAATTNSLILRPGDSIKVNFPGAPNLDAQTTIRLDGKINLPMIGELTAATLTPAELEKELLRVAGPQLVVKEVTVSVVSSAFEIYVSGAVLRPGKLVTDRMMSPLEAVMEAGIDYQKANLKNVQVIRKQENGPTQNFKLNLKQVLDGKGDEPFTLKQYDIIYVPERFSWF